MFIFTEFALVDLTNYTKGDHFNHLISASALGVRAGRTRLSTETVVGNRAEDGTNPPI